MTIIMNEVMQGESKFARQLNASLPRTVSNPENEEEHGVADWHQFIKNRTQVYLQATDKTLQPAFAIEGDEGVLPFLYQSMCIEVASLGSSVSYNMNLPYYDDATRQETPVIEEITSNLLKDGIYIPFLMFISLDDYNAVMEAAKADQDMYTFLVAELTSKARGENLTDFYVASLNLSELVARMELKEEDFDGAESLRVIYPMLMSAVAGENSSPYPPEIFQSSTYFQNPPVGDEEVSEIDE